MKRAVERVRGVRDANPAEYAARSAVAAKLREPFARFGYAFVEPAILEHTDLFLLKSGEDVITKLYAFDFRNRALCLRPEFTASIARMYVEELQGVPKPVRLAYEGPVFRYEKPGRGRLRQFTQIGVELIGASGPLADAEVVALACQGLEVAGLSDYQVEIGHLGIIGQLLEGLGLDGRAREFVLARLPDLARSDRGLEYALDRLGEVYPDTPTDDGAAALPSVDLAALGEEQVRTVIELVLRQLNLVPSGGRTPAEVTERILGKLRWWREAPRIREALAVAARLGQLKGRADEVQAALRAVVAEYRLDPTPLEELRAVVDLVAAQGIAPERLVLNLGLGRGLQYYTGLVFEVYAAPLGPDLPLAGGGRYDDLLALVGATGPTPACGFGYGLERVLLALEARGRGATAPPAADVLVVPVSYDDRLAAARAAAAFRAAGLRAELDVKGRGLKANVQHADRLGIRYVAVLGEAERAAGRVRLRDMAARAEAELELAAAVERVRSAAPHAGAPQAPPGTLGDPSSAAVLRPEEPGRASLPAAPAASGSALGGEAPGGAGSGRGRPEVRP